MTQFKPAVWIGFLAGVMSGTANDVLKNLPADSWYEVPNSAMRSVCASDSQFPGISPYGPSGCRMVMEAWNGGAYDPMGKKLWIWGGGHGDYYGNELYAFDIEGLRWERVTDPSPITQLSQDPMPDGSPVSRHTYDGLAFITHANRLFGYGGSMAGNGYGTQVTWVFDPAKKTWSNMNPVGSDNRPTTACCNFGGEYDPSTHKVFLRDPNWLCAYDFDRNTWEHALAWTHSWGPGKGVLDSKRHLLFTIGSGEFLVYDIGGNRDVSAAWGTTGDDSLVRSYGGGAAYDPISDALVGWQGGSPYVLDLQTKVWSRKSGTGAPAQQVSNGTFGRFRYIPDDNVFILANGVDSNVYFYKLSAGGAVSINANPAHLRKRSQPHIELTGSHVRFWRGEKIPVNAVGQSDSHTGNP